MLFVPLLNRKIQMHNKSLKILWPYKTIPWDILTNPWGKNSRNNNIHQIGTSKAIMILYDDYHIYHIEE